MNECACVSLAIRSCNRKNCNKKNIYVYVYAVNNIYIPTKLFVKFANFEREADRQSRQPLFTNQSESKYYTT